MSAASLGANFEREIRTQPDVWLRLSQSSGAEALARALADEIVLLGSGSSLFIAELGALALRRRGIAAEALAATEARLDNRAYQRKVVVAISQSGRSTDVLQAIEMLAPRRVIALTNTVDSPLAARAELALDVGAGPEIAVPASKSVTATVAILLWAASVYGGDSSREPDVLASTARSVGEWLRGPLSDVIEAAREIAQRQSVAMLGSDYGLPVSREIALKLKEASYLHAEGFAAGEFRHGSVSMVDASFAVIGIVDRDALPLVARPLREVQASGALRYAIGRPAIDRVPSLGPEVDEPYNTLAWLVTGQMIALHSSRARGIDSDAPRGLTKALVAE